MAEALSRRQELERTPDGKRAHGHRVEPHDDTQAVLSMRGRRRFLHLAPRNDVRYRLSLDEHGRASSRRIEAVAAPV